MVAGSVYYLSTSTTWAAADADSANVIKMLAVAKGTSSSQGMLLNGVFRKASHGFSVGDTILIYSDADPMGIEKVITAITSTTGGVKLLM